MRFMVFDKGGYPPRGYDLFYLCRDNWDDYGYKTSFDSFYYDTKGVRVEIGPVKIGYTGMVSPSRVFDKIPHVFDKLNTDFFSLGQSEEYYERLTKLGNEKREEILKALRDIAFDLSIFEKVSKEKVIEDSFLRSTTAFAIKNQLNRMANGGTRLTEYKFSYISPAFEAAEETQTFSLDFLVTPYSNPPTNIHVIIGRNGTGKTRLLQNMIRSIRLGDGSFGEFNYMDDSWRSKKTDEHFANILCIAFSPFDDFSCTLNGESSVPYTYIGLDKKRPNLLQNIKSDFLNAFLSCMDSAKKKLLLIKAIETLKSDPTFSESGIDSYIQRVETDEGNAPNTEMQDEITNYFLSLSSGHKVTLLIITSCVDKLEEKSIVFMDEPENHLHPPLLSAFIRAFSDLLIERNGVAIVSTHSPVVLQEVPKSCVWALRRIGNIQIAERLQVETFGSSISLLTSQVFGLEVTDSGFHKMLSDAAREIGDYDKIIEKFDGNLGDEARAILRTLLVNVL